MPQIKPSDGVIVATVVLGVVIGLLWVLHLATVATLGRSDAAGNAIGEAYAAIQIIALWSLHTIMTVIASLRGAAPGPAKVAAPSIVVPVSGFIAMSAADLLARSHMSPFLWPIFVIPAVVPSAGGDLEHGRSFGAIPDIGYRRLHASGRDSGGVPPDPAAIAHA